MTTQTLKLADDLFADLDTGKKTGTIRYGKRSIELGPLELLAVSDPERVKRMVDVVRVSYTTVANLTQDDVELDGSASIEDLLTLLRRFYPDMEDRDILTILKFAPLN